MKNSVFNNQKGQTIIELLMALSVFIIGFLGIITLLSNSLGHNRFVTDAQIATYLAAEGIEIVRNTIDTNLQKTVLWRNGLPVGSYEVDHLDRSTRDNFKITSGVCHYFNTYDSGSLSLQPLYYHEDTRTYDYNPAGGVISPYTREITIDYLSVRADGSLVSSLGSVNAAKKHRDTGRPLVDDVMVVHSIVRWQGAGGLGQVVDLEDQFFNWQDSEDEEPCRNG